MQLPLRGVYGGWRGLGESGEVDTEGGSLPGGTIDFSSGETDPSEFYQPPGFNIIPTPGVDLTPAELSAEQTRARAWLASIPGALSVAGKVALSASQIAAGLAAGNLKPSSTCTSGYLVAGSGQCVTGPSGSLFSGVSNQTLGLLGIGFVFVMLISSGKK